ncbi:Thiamine transporter 2 [Eumeta japonica]|uniref:Thiamine transporter 2 n=1 Tax=Eumeta variegata TaxID=151549 RepID=A0A4C1TQH5_EUMVA|nr:Thiamine transporter 2 [Eumeta japonica]
MQVDPEKYPKVSSFTRMASLSGRFLSGVSAQVLISLDVMNYRDLNYITLTAQILATVWALWLPSVKYGIYFHRKTSLTDSVQTETNLQINRPTHDQESKKGFKKNFLDASTLIIHHSYVAYRKSKVIIWSLLYASVLALYMQVQTYVQLLWKEMQSDSDSTMIYNGAVEAATTLFGAGGAYIASMWGPNPVPVFVTGLQGGLLFMATYPGNIYLSYVGYILVGVMFHYTITLASAQVAGQLSDDGCFGLIFGINTLIGTGLQSLLTFVLISENALELPIVSQIYAIIIQSAKISAGTYYGSKDTALCDRQTGRWLNEWTVRERRLRNSPVGTLWKLRYAPLTLCAHNESETRPFHSGMVSPPKSERETDIKVKGTRPFHRSYS